MKRLLLAAALTACTVPAIAGARSGVSMTSFDNPFLTILLNGMKDEAARTAGVELMLEDALLDVSRQLSQVQNLMAGGKELQVPPHELGGTI